MDMFHSLNVVPDAQRDKVGSKIARLVWSQRPVTFSHQPQKYKDGYSISFSMCIHKMFRLINARLM